MPRNDASLKPFILDALVRQKYPNLLWLDETTRLFKLTFSRFGGRGPWKEDEKILQDYEHLIKHPYEGYSKARVSLTTAVKSSDGFKMVKEIKDGNVFQLRCDIGSIPDDLDLTLQAELFFTEEATETHLWPRNSVLTLIECYRAHQEEMEDPGSKKKEVWSSVAEMMRERGEFITADMCSSKWRNLRRTYKVIQERKRLSPFGRQHSWEYFDLLHQTYSRDYGMDQTSLSCGTYPKVNFVDPTLIRNPPNIDETVMEGSDQKERNANETIERCLQGAHRRNCAEVRKLRECIEESNKLSGEKNEILKNSLKERNQILRKFLREKNDTLKELLKTYKTAV